MFETCCDAAVAYKNRRADKARFIVGSVSKASSCVAHPCPLVFFEMCNHSKPATEEIEELLNHIGLNTSSDDDFTPSSDDFKLSDMVCILCIMYSDSF